MPISDELAALRSHRNQIHRYRRLLKSQLAEYERQYFERRLSEERHAFEALAAAAFPLAFEIPHAPAGTGPARPG
ncbi:hypothetical protein [Bradyrhizobium neotropicale]|uniref:hypothetical protein n=1 Tax=Bradyrhizobium neotropicale TaxID=1497615 RepID=UPI0009EF618C|nr:hypothetical protein [Bradyrhizobium neotropicale]